MKNMGLLRHKDIFGAFQKSGGSARFFAYFITFYKFIQ